jgi:hypothetical protein
VYSVQSHRHTGIVIGRDSCDSRAKCQRYIFLVSLDTVPSLADEIAQLLVGGAEPRRQVHLKTGSWVVKDGHGWPGYDQDVPTRSAMLAPYKHSNKGF